MVKVGVFLPVDDDLHVEVLTAFAKGGEAVGLDLDYVFLDDEKGRARIYDIAVVFGIRKTRVPKSFPRGDVIDAHRKQGKTIVVLERGFVHRDRYFSAGFGGINGRADFNNEARGADRWLQLETPLEPMRNGGSHIVLCGQVPWDASVQHTDHIGWIAEASRKLRDFTDLPILFRPHPLAADSTPSFIGTERSTGPLDNDLAGAAAVVTFNSNTGVEALIRGIPVLSFDEGSMVYSVTPHEFRILPALIRGKCLLPDRGQWANNLAYAQWNLEEMAQGLPWRHLFK